MIEKVKLYIKASTRGLQYFGKTIRDPHKYKGSGTYWTAHLKKHQPEVQTIVIGEYSVGDPMLIEHALGFSAANDIVLSNDWANMVPENGLDGAAKGRVVTEESRIKCSVTKKGKSVMKDANGKIHYVASNDPRIELGELTGLTLGHQASEETKNLMSMQQSGFHTVIDENGKSIRIHKDDPKWINGEVVSINRGKINVVDSKGKGYRVRLDDKRLISGEFKTIHAGKSNSKAKAIFAENIYFEYMQQATDFLGVGRDTIRKRVNSDKYPNYQKAQG